jgi:hypothetical protein
MYGRAKGSIISSGGQMSNSPFKKVRSDVNLDRAESPDMLKRLSRPRFDQLNDTEDHNNTLSRVQTVHIVDGQELSARGMAQGDRNHGGTSPHSDARHDDRLSQGPSVSL